MAVPQKTQPDTARRLAAIGIGVSIVVTALKALAYWRTGSLAFYSDALESIVNVITAAVAAFAVHLAGRPADTRHQYGHHKAEYFAAVLEGVLILLAAAAILRDAVAAWHVPHPLAVASTLSGIGASSIATVINAVWGALLIRRGKVLRAPALVADGWHIVSDVVTSIGVVAGLGLALLTGWRHVDAILAAAVACYIVFAGWRIMQSSMSSLMDEALAAEILRRIQTVIGEKGSGAIEAHDIRTRMAGRVSYIEFHLVVPGDMSVARSHQICDRLETALAEAVPGASVLIHVEPHAKAKGSVDEKSAVII